MKIIGKAAFELQDPAAFEPHGDRLLVEVIDLESAVYTANDVKIVIPETSDMEVERGWQLATIVAIGDGHRLETDTTVPIREWFTVGDVVMIERLTGRKMRLQHKNYLIISQIDVLGKPFLPKPVATAPVTKAVPAPYASMHEPVPVGV